MTLPDLQKEALDYYGTYLARFLSASQASQLHVDIKLTVEKAYQAGKDAAVEYIKQYSPATRSKRIYSVHIDTLEKARQAL